MFLNWLTWREVAEDLHARLRGARIVEVFSQQKDELLIGLRLHNEELYLQYSAAPGFTWLLPKTGVARARKNTIDLFPDLRGATIDGVHIAAHDRILRLSLDGGGGLYFSLIPSRGNALFCDDTCAVIDRFKRGDLPLDVSTLRFDNGPCFPDRDEAASALHASQALPAADALKRLRPYFHGLLAKEALYRAGLEGTEPVASMSDGDRDALRAIVIQIFEELSSARPCIILEHGAPRFFSLLRLQQPLNADVQDCESVIDGLAQFVRKYWSGREFATLRKRVLAAAERELDKTERRIAALRGEAEIQREAGQYRKYGNLLMIHLLEPPSQPDRMIVPDVFVDPRLVVSIPLAPELSVVENAERYFDKARKFDSSLEYVAGRRASLQRERDTLHTLLKQVRDAETLQDARTALRIHASLLRRLGLTEKGNIDDSPFPFRRFTVAGGFEVWVGKNSANNDELTVRHARPNDLWFHARGVGGSHVVLKTGTAAGVPGKDAIRQAAAIAAWYSKHRKAKNVPVAWTEKKYVRKPKGAPAGTVIMEREKVIMVQPMLPPGAADE
jgi:predicted ribosome quality control (RQC) complex YloA/Tae2 family protein